MGDMNLSAATASDLANAQPDFSVSPAITDAAGEQKETRWVNSDWSKYLGYYKKIPELQAAIDIKATWTIGKGYKADPLVQLHLMQIRGWGKDTFNTILENNIRTYHIGGDSFDEIVRNEKTGVITNLKPLDPSTITIVANSKGIIIRYEQNSKVEGKKPKEFDPDEIFHLARNRVADEIHGVSLIPAVEEIILMRNEAMTDMKLFMHRNVAPRWIIHMDTDNEEKIAAFKTKYENTYKTQEIMFVPKGAVVPELVSVPANSTLNPLPWIESLTQKFNDATGVPEIIVGSGKQFTEASAKIKYLAWQQTIEEEQLYIEEQMEAQLKISIELTFPADLTNDALSGTQKEEEVNPPEIEQESANQPNDTTAEMEGRK